MLALVALALSACLRVAGAPSPLSTADVRSAGLAGSVSFASAVVQGVDTMNDKVVARAYDLAVWRGASTELVCIDVTGVKSFAGWVGAAHGSSMAKATEMTVRSRRRGFTDRADGLAERRLVGPQPAQSRGRCRSAVRLA